MWPVQKGREEKWPGIRYGMAAKNALTTTSTRTGPLRLIASRLCGELGSNGKIFGGI